MNIFEDLIEELKEENLLESAVVKTAKTEIKSAPKKEIAVETVAAPEIPAEQIPAAEVVPTVLPEVRAEEVQAAESLVNEAEFYRQRAINEVAFLQIVEHVLAGVEREQLKIVPHPYNDLEVKKVLHSFLQFAPDTDAAAYAKAEFQLLQETESWHSSLTLRDERLTTSHLRRFCETSRPPLSSPALVALARFYRNSPFSEPVRNKFDLVVTRLFSKETINSQRETVFSRDELAAHLAELYAEWSSVPMYATETNDAEILSIVEKFESFSREADDALAFDDLIKSDFYTRLHSFKRSTNENFYAPLITAVGIESNIHIGNRYVELLENEKNKGNIAGLEDRYGFTHDNAISEATGKTFTLIELLKQRKPEPVVAETPVRSPEPIREKVKPQKKEKSPSTETSSSFISKNQRILIAAGVIIVLILIYFGTGSKPIENSVFLDGKPKVDVNNSMLRDYLHDAHIENETLYGIVMPNWTYLSEPKRRDVIKKMLASGEKTFTRVQFKNNEGKIVADTAADGSIMFTE